MNVFSGRVIGRFIIPPGCGQKPFWAQRLPSPIVKEAEAPKWGHATIGLLADGSYVIVGENTHETYYKELPKKYWAEAAALPFKEIRTWEGDICQIG